MARSRRQDKTLPYAGPDTPVAAPRGPSRGVLLAACALLSAGVAFAYAGSGWASLLYRLLVDGAVLVVWLACAAGAGSAVLALLPLGRTELPPDAQGPSSLSPVPGGEGRGEGQPRRATPTAKEAPASGATPIPDPLGGSADLLLHLVTAAALGLGLFSLAVLGLGLAGWLNNWTAAGLLFIGAALGLVPLLRSRTRPDRDAVGAWLRGPAGLPAWLWLAAMPFLGLAVVVALLPPGLMWPEEPHGYDVVEYHLQIPREWYEAGRIVPLRHNAFSFFPFNVEMHYLLAMHLRGGPWAGMYLAHFMHLAMVVLTVAAVYGFARRLSASRTAATIASVAVATTPWLTQLGTVAYNEGGLLLFGTLAMGWAFEAALRPARRLGRFPVAGLLAGFACGSKLTGVPEVLFAVGGLAAIAILTDRSTSRVRSEERAQPRIEPPDSGQDIRGSASPRSRLVDDARVSLPLRLAGVAAFFLAGMLTFAPWLIRNQVWAGNPLFPEAARLLGQAHFSDAQVERWEQAHSPRPDQRSPGARVDAWRKDVWKNWQYGYLLIPLSLAAGVAACVRGQNRVPALLLIGMFAGLSVVWLGFTHLQGRFFILGVPIAGMLLALLPRGRVAGAVAAALFVAAAVPSYGRLHALLVDRFTATQRAALLGFEQLSAALVPPAMEQVPSDVPLALAGDARAFVYAAPGGRLSYRTVFDVQAKPGQSVIEAWTEGAPPGSWVLVDPVELGRFHRTYRHIPPLPPEFSQRPETFALPPNARPDR